MTLNFGGFLSDVPRRLGVNAALDAATDAFVIAANNFRAGRRGPDEMVLKKHANAIHALRTCLDHPPTAHASETLCAIQMIMIYQVSVIALRPYSSLIE